MIFLITPLWAWLTWKRPTAGFVLLPFFLPLYVFRASIGPFPTTALELAIFGLIIGWIANQKWEGVRHAATHVRPWVWAMGAWMIAGAIGVVTAWANGFSVIAALGLFRAYFIEPLMVFVIGRSVLHDSKDRGNLFLAFTAVAVLLAAIAVFQYITGFGIPHPWDAWPGRRSTGPFPFPNALALFLVPLGALGASWIFTKPLPTHFGERHFLNRIAPVFMVASALIGTFLAESDGGLIALGVAIIAVLLFNTKTRIATAAIIATLALLIVVVTPLREQATEKLFFQEWSGKVRLVIWQETTNLIQDNPFFGAGLAAYPQAILPYHTATWMEVFQYPHNIVLNLWTELGIPGLLAFAFIILVWLREARRIDVTIPVILAILVHGLVDVPYFKNDLAIAFWLLILLTMTYTSEPNSN